MGADAAMRSARNLVGYFLGSTQASCHLIEVQIYYILLVYKDYNKEHLIQDMITSWWSTWRMFALLPPVSKACNQSAVVQQSN